VDCNGLPIIDDDFAEFDDCGVCAGGSTGLTFNGDMDCNGDCAVDTDTSCVGLDCGTSVVDDCGVCSGGSTGLTFNGDMDCHGECAVDTPTSCEGPDCGTALEDYCGDCSGGNSGHVGNSAKGCDGVCYSGLVYDECGTCGGTGVLDECGRCDGGYFFTCGDNNDITCDPSLGDDACEDVDGIQVHCTTSEDICDYNGNVLEYHQHPHKHRHPDLDHM
jgi:hypothetical protein